MYYSHDSLFFFICPTEVSLPEGAFSESTDMPAKYQERMKEGGDRGDNRKIIGGRGKKGRDPKEAREIDMALGRASIEQSSAIKFSVLNRSLIEVEK